LSGQIFENCEFKEIHKAFILNYPEFKMKKYYGKIYQEVRELENYKLFIIDRTTNTYKYTSVVNTTKFEKLIDSLEEFEIVKNQLVSDYHQAQTEVHQIKSELNVFNKYIKLYPNIKSKISILAGERKSDLIRLESELSALDLIIQNI
jgi:hypothetical protein